MSNFPVGSKIIVTNAEEGETYKNGEIYTVNYPAGPGVYVTAGVQARYLASYEFEAYTEYKVGDKVVVIKTNEEWGYKLGDRGTVDYIDSQEPKVRLKGAGYHFTEDLKLAPAKAEPTPTNHIKVLATRHPREYEVGDILEVHAEQWNSLEAGEIRVVNKHGGNSIVFKGQWEYVAAPVDEPERKFKVGDKVVVQANPEWAKEGQTGVIERVDLEDSGLPYDVKWDNEQSNLWMRAQDLELVKEFAFTDILKGDTIRAEYTQNGIKHTREGVVHEGWNGEHWFSAEGDYVANSFWKGATYTLLERPEPPKPNPFAEAKVGSIATYGEEGIKYLKTGENAWAPISRKGTLSDYRNSDESMTNCGDLIQVTHNA